MLEGIVKVFNESLKVELNESSKDVLKENTQTVKTEDKDIVLL